jgi:hypothetical protein
MEQHPEADAVCAYGMYRYYPLNFYYDTYAHIDKGDSFHINGKIFSDIRKRIEVKYERGEEPHQVESCFSGFTVYMSDSLLNHKYDFPSEDNIECEHVILHRKMNKVMLNPSMIFLMLKND